MMAASAGYAKKSVNRPQIAGSVSKRSVGNLAERLFRKNLAAQYVEDGGHPFFLVEDELIQASVKEIREQLRNVIPVHLTVAGIHLHVMESAEYLAACEDVADVDDDTLKNAVAGVEKDSLALLLEMCLPE